MHIKAITSDTFRNYGGTDMCVFDSDSTADSAAPLHHRVLRSMTVEEYIKFLAEEINKDPKKLRLWLMVNRQNKTIRPDQPIMDLTPTIEEVFTRSVASRDVYLRVWVEEAEELDDEGNAVWPSYSGQPNGVLVRNDTILFLLKHFDLEQQTLRGVGHVYIGKDKKVEDLVPLIAKKMGWGDIAGAEDKLLLWEVGFKLHLPKIIDCLLMNCRKSNQR